MNQTFTFFSVLIYNKINIGSYNPHITKSSLGSSILLKSVKEFQSQYLRTAQPEFLTALSGTYKFFKTL